MTRAFIHQPESLKELDDAFAAAGIEPGDVTEGLIFFQRAGDLASFDDVAVEMLESFRLTKQAVAADAPIVYLVHTQDLLGQRGALSAMLASGLLSAARSMGMEGVRDHRVANALAFDDDVEISALATWVHMLLTTKDMTGDLVSLGRGHLGKALA